VKLNEFKSDPMLVIESNYKILTPLTMMAKDILGNVQYRIDANEVTRMKIDISDSVREQLKEYGDIFDMLCDYLHQYVPLIFANRASATLKGAYSHSVSQEASQLDDIVLYLPAILKTEPRSLSTSEVKSKPVETTLVHELRHVMQRRQFGSFYHKMVGKQQTDDYNYHTDPIEIDAAFLHHLHDEEATNVKDFVDGVMSRFSNYKKLTPRQYEHYKKKAAAYFYAKQSPDTKSSTPKDRLAAKKKARLDNAIQTLLDTDIEPLGDLRNVGSSNSGRFQINPNQFRSVLLGAIRNEVSNKLNVALGIGFLGFMKKINPSIPVQPLINNMNVSLDELIDLLKDTDLQGFDKKLFINAIKSLK
jgi:hypothetical protein